MQLVPDGDKSSNVNMDSIHCSDKESKASRIERYTEAWVLGMPKLWLAVLNVGAVFLICLMFYQDRHESMAQTKQDRELFRTSIDKLNDSINKQSEALRYMAIQVQRLNTGSRPLKEESPKQ